MSEFQNNHPNSGSNRARGGGRARGARGSRGNSFRGKTGARGKASAAINGDHHLLVESNSTSTPQQVVVEEESSSTANSSSHLSTTTFSSLSSKIDSRLLSSIPQSFSFMTQVQEKTLDPALSGVDLLAQAKTGTGKTLAFLIPSIQAICTMESQPPKGAISVLCLSPTRELALQIKQEAKMLLTGMKGQLDVQCCVGGTNINVEKRSLSSQRCDLLIATPGRLVDHLQNSGIAPQFQNLRVLILDEADRMLDMGFKQELEKIMSFLPDRNQVKRQHLLFSATIPESIHRVSNLDENHQFINTLGEDETNTHQHVEQELVVADFVDFLPLSLEIVQKEMRENEGKAKVIYFFPTARWTGLAAEVFRNLKGDTVPKVFEIHSRKSQPQRAKASEEFKNAESGIMLSSDVAARGVDWPGVTAVVQVGLPSSGEQYIHRLGRTARAGKSGHGILILSPSEKFFVKKGEMKDLPLKEISKDIFTTLKNSKKHMEEALGRVNDEVKSQCYAANLGYYKPNLKDLRWKPETLVSEMNMFAIQALLFSGGDGSIPPVMAKTVGKMGLKGVQGLNIVRELPAREGSSSNNGSRGGRGGGNQTRGGHHGGPPVGVRGGPKSRSSNRGAPY